MSNFLIFESSNNVVDAIDVFNVAQEMISESLSLGGSSDDTGNINNLKNSCNFGFGLIDFA